MRAPRQNDWYQGTTAFRLVTDAVVFLFDDGLEERWQ